MLPASNGSMKLSFKLRIVFIVVLWLSWSFNVLLQLQHFRSDLQIRCNNPLRWIGFPKGKVKRTKSRNNGCNEMVFYETVESSSLIENINSEDRFVNSTRPALETEYDNNIETKRDDVDTIIVVDPGDGSNSGVTKKYPSLRQSSSIKEQLDVVDHDSNSTETTTNDASLDNSAIGSESESDDGLEVHNFVSPYSIYKKNETHAPRFAYAYVISGCNEEASHRNYLYDIAISTYTQRESGSTADVIVFIQMAYKSSLEELVERDRKLLDVMNIIVKYIPKTAEESFYRTMLDKFLILGLVQYDRVLYMDGDVVARGSLDYLFDLSVKGVLKRNIVLVGLSEPASGGFFMISPNNRALDRIMTIIRDKEERGKKLPFPHWDEEIGWGQRFEEGDFARVHSGRQYKKWNFYGAFADQGLLYHWVKYEEKSVSILFKHSIENWDLDTNGTLVEQRMDSIFFNEYTVDRVCWSKKRCKAPFIDFIHFTGKSKPWLQPPPNGFETDAISSSKHYWYNTLFVLDSKMKLGIDFVAGWKKQKRPLHGLYPTHHSASKTSYSSGDGQNVTVSLETK